jgi:3-hydroxybutyryl-CoA dehydrogenase
LTAACGFDAVGPVDLVVEAVPEIISLKQDVLRRAQTAFPEALLATNTSSLSINELAHALAVPSALVGMHFFNPVPSSSLIEIVVGATTDPSVVERARTWADQMGKQSIEVRDSPGFATSRLGLAIGLEAMRMLEDGVASAADIDLAMVLGYKYPLGPLELTDRVGLDVRLAIARHLESELGPRFAPPQVLVDLVASGHLGRKTGQGFYGWQGGRRGTGPSSPPA